jgi:hypothetical protein
MTRLLFSGWREHAYLPSASDSTLALEGGHNTTLLQTPLRKRDGVSQGRGAIAITSALNGLGVIKIKRLAQQVFRLAF